MFGLHTERDTPPFLTLLVAVFSFSQSHSFSLSLSLSQLLRQSRDCTRPPPPPRPPSVQLSPPRSRTQRALGRWSRPSAASSASQNPSRLNRVWSTSRRRRLGKITFFLLDFLVYLQLHGRTYSTCTCHVHLGLTANSMESDIFGRNGGHRNGQWAETGMVRPLIAYLVALYGWMVARPRTDIRLDILMIY